MIGARRDSESSGLMRSPLVKIQIYQQIYQQKVMHWFSTGTYPQVHATSSGTKNPAHGRAVISVQFLKVRASTPPTCRKSARKYLLAQWLAQSLDGLTNPNPAAVAGNTAGNLVTVGNHTASLMPNAAPPKQPPARPPTRLHRFRRPQ